MVGSGFNGNRVQFPDCPRNGKQGWECHAVRCKALRRSGKSLNVGRFKPTGLGCPFGKAALLGLQVRIPACNAMLRALEHAA